MSRALRVALPFLVAWAVPATGLFVAYLAVGASVYAALVGGVLGGTIGPGGAALAMLVQRTQARRAELDEGLEWLRDRDRREREFDELVQLGQEQDRERDE